MPVNWLRISLITVSVALVTSFCACTQSRRDTYTAAARMTGGDPHTGMKKVRQYGCPACHTIPGIQGANGLVGPPLTRVGSRMVIAGQLQNTPPNMTFWIQHPHAVLPHTVMPDMGVTEQDSRDIAAYLYTLR